MLKPGDIVQGGRPHIRHIVQFAYHRSVTWCGIVCYVHERARGTVPTCLWCIARWAGNVNDVQTSGAYLWATDQSMRPR